VEQRLLKANSLRSGQPEIRSGQKWTNLESPVTEEKSWQRREKEFSSFHSALAATTQTSHWTPGRGTTMRQVHMGHRGQKSSRVQPMGASGALRPLEAEVPSKCRVIVPRCQTRLSAISRYLSVLHAQHDSWAPVGLALGPFLKISFFEWFAVSLTWDAFLVRSPTGGRVTAASRPGCVAPEAPRPGNRLKLLAEPATKIVHSRTVYDHLNSPSQGPQEPSSLNRLPTCVRSSQRVRVSSHLFPTHLAKTLVLKLFWKRRYR
jgi:hypothetical protein